MILRWTETAVKDLEEIVTFISADSPDAARRVAQTILFEVETLKTFSLRGRLTDRTILRELSIPPLPYVIRYRVSDQVQIVRIMHGARRR